MGLYKDSELIGFVLTIPAMDKNQKPYHHLHMIGIHPNHRGENYGYLLMKRHFEISKEMNVEKITWTYDPLESFNANLYIKKCGAIVESHYLENYYEDQLDGMLLDIPTDRFLATWYIHKDKKDLFNSRDAFFSIIELEEEYLIANDFPIDSILSNQTYVDKIAVEIPNDIQELKKSDIEKALDWRYRTRKIFSFCLNNNYVLINFVRVLNNTVLAP